MRVVPYGLSDSQPCNPHVAQHATGRANPLFLPVLFLLRKGHLRHACGSCAQTPICRIHASYTAQHSLNPQVELCALTSI
jgi:hypothetical protein